MQLLYPLWNGILKLFGNPVEGVTNLGCLNKSGSGRYDKYDMRCIIFTASSHHISSGCAAPGRDPLSEQKKTSLLELQS